MTRHSCPRTAAYRRSSTRAAMAVGWALLAAVGVAGLASTNPVAAQGVGPGPGRVPTVEGVSAAAPPAPVVAQPVPPATVVTATSPTAVTYHSSPYGMGNPDRRAAVAVRAAMAQIGLPYEWGGDGPASGDAGFDCSGLHGRVVQGPDDGRGSRARRLRARG